MPRTALVTGSSGFIGRHMVKRLKDDGWDVRGIDIVDLPFEPNVNRYFEVGFGSYDLVVHCAYHVGGRAAIDGLNLNFIKNVQLDANMFDWAIRTKQKAVIYFSSSAAYPVCYQQKWDRTRDAGPIRLQEDLIDLDDYESPSLPDADYGWAKLNGERLAKSAGDNGLRVHVLRPFSGYGADQSLDYPFPSIVRRAQEGDLTVWGPRGQRRDWLHISDVLSGALRVYEDDDRRPVNLCTGVGTEMGELMRMAWKNSHPDEADGPLQWPVKYLEDKPTGVYHRVGDPTRMNEHYIAKISIEEGVHAAVQDFRGGV